MKEIVISHITALLAFRLIRTENNFTCSLDDLIAMNNMLSSNQKIHILLDSQNNKIKNSNYKCHINLSKLPKGSLKIINDNLKIVSPEFMLIQLSKSLNYEDLFLLILELCGSYSINPLDKSFVNNILPITNIKTIKNYLARYKNMNPYAKGVNKILKICKYAQDGSASPMESRLFIKLCAPKTQGLYGCKGLKLNQKINISNKAKLIAGQNYIIPDISCVKKKVAIEYDSAQFHENTTRGQRDKRRRDALVHDGWKVITLVPSQINNPNVFHTIAIDIKKALKEDTRIRVKNFYKKRSRAFENLM